MSGPNASREQLARRHSSMRQLTSEQVREIRLSMLATGVLAKAYHVGTGTIVNARSGLSYGPLQDDEAAAHRKRSDPPDLRPPHPRETLLIGAKFPILGRPDLNVRLDRVRLLDAENECSHGRLQGDPTPPCGCWSVPLRVLAGDGAQLDIYDFDLEAA